MTESPSKPVGELPEREVSAFVQKNPWEILRAFTDARIGLGRAGISLPTKALLEFQLAHAQAQDAVHTPLALEVLCRDLQGLCHDLQELTGSTPLRLHSCAEDRASYLQRPDLGRQLAPLFRQELMALATQAASPPDLAIVVADGLSALAVQRHAAPMLQALFARLVPGDSQHWSLAPLCVVQQGRVAIGDDIGAALNARSVLVLIGERPGLSSPDSLGLYLTWGPKPGLTDASRNCISNVREGGLGYTEAADKIFYLLQASRRLQRSGVTLKERAEHA
ncbi:MAG: ethanolamine ammonia-lyase subunit EutC [Hahellaceae bacterium]|nr:ethanolamine ammonia-lyase subunit EutC [Hahellaceae bacterium]MCP5168297.1 ethanolamine ammonia-lyase subunit EutC [Hahellaceae bacterium]